MQELLNDTRLLKKLRKGKITEAEFEKGLLSRGCGKHAEGWATDDDDSLRTEEPECRDIGGKT